jgi:hypothetical protein
MDENDINDLAQSLLRALQTSANAQSQAANQAASAANNLKSALIKIATGGNLTADELKEVAKASGRSADSLDDLNKAVRNVGPTITGLAGSLVRGQTTFSTLNGVIQNTANLMGGLMGLIPVVGSGLNQLSQAAGKTATFMVERFDDAYGSFEKLSQIGSVGATGIGHVVEGFDRLQVPLSTYASLVSKNSQSLALLSGTASAGADAFTKAAGDLKESGLDMRLRTLGFSTEEISDTMIAYADLQRRLGSEEAMTQTNLKNGAMAYGKELDELARLTGKSREAAQQAQRQQLLDARFNAKLRQMEANNQGEAAAELRKAVTAQQLMGNQQMAQAIMSSATGFFVTPEAQAAVVSMNGFSKSVQDLASGMTSAKDFSQQIQDQAKVAADQFGPLAQAIGADSPVTKLYVEQTNLASASAGKIAKAFDQAEKDITKAQLAPEERTVELAKAKVSLEEAASIMSKLVLDQSVVTKLVQITAGLTNDTAAAVSALINQLSGVSGAGPAPLSSSTAKTQAIQNEGNAQLRLNELKSSGVATTQELANAEQELLTARLKAKLEHEKQVAKVQGTSREPNFKSSTIQKLETAGLPVPKTTQELESLVYRLESSVAPTAAPTQTPMPSIVPPASTLPSTPAAQPSSAGSSQSGIDNNILGAIASNTANTNSKIDALSASVDKLSRGMLS